MSRRVLGAALAALALPAAPAFAQAASPAKPAETAPSRAPDAKPTSSAVEGVTVVGTAPPVRASIDRKSYSVTNDLQATSGSISDALRNIPSVEVDLQGNVSLRGDPNVTIMIDGKPSGMFRGDGKGQALQSLAADQIDRVEVITNPSAEFKPDGTGGIINLITKKTRKPGTTGSLRANIGSDGRHNVAGSVARAGQTLTLSGDAAYRRDGFHQVFADTRSTADPVLGGFRDLGDSTDSLFKVDILTGHLGLDYNPDAKAHWSAGLRYNGFDFHSHFAETFAETLPDGTAASVYDRDGSISQRRRDVEGTAGYDYRFDSDRTLSASATLEWQTDHRDRPAVTTYQVPAQPDAYDENKVHNLFWRSEAKVSYETPLPDKAKLKLGYEFDGDDNDYGNSGARGPSAAAAAPDPALINRFNFDQQVHAAYATYQRPIGKLTVLAGLRLEAVRIDLDQVTQGVKGSNDYDRAYPSLHLSYNLSEAQQLTASASRRVQRPQPLDFNPFRQYLDPQNYRAGNPGLKPQQTDSYELGYQYRKHGAILLATAYYRDGKDAVNDVTRDIGDGVFLTTKANIGGFETVGLELVANGRLPWRLSYNVSGNAQWNRIESGDLGFGSADRSGYSVFGRATLSWQATSSDFVQLSGFLNGRRLTPQGHAEPTGMLNIGYRHKFDDRVAFVVTVQDAAKTFRDKRVIDTPTLKDVVRAHGNFQGISFGLTYTFGGGRQRDPGFDFGSGAPPG